VIAGTSGRNSSRRKSPARPKALSGPAAQCLSSRQTRKGTGHNRSAKRPCRRGDVECVGMPKFTERTINASPPTEMQGCRHVTGASRPAPPTCPLTVSSQGLSPARRREGPSSAIARLRLLTIPLACPPTVCSKRLLWAARECLSYTSAVNHAQSHGWSFQGGST
jgi:hypothetical protein